MKVNNKKNMTILFFQLVIFMYLWRTEVNAEMVEGCAFSTMTLTCNETKVINISSVVLGDSPGCKDANCCPRPNHCTAKPNDNHVNEVHRRCNGRLTCTVPVIQEKIPCESTLFWDHKNDFERITYDCIDNGITSTAHYNEVVMTTILVDGDETSDANFMNESVTSVTIPDIDKTTEAEILPQNEAMFPVPVLAIAITIIIVLTVIILLSVIILKKKKTWLKPENEEELLEVRNFPSEEIYANEDQIQTGNIYSSSLSIDRVQDYQNKSKISKYENANKVTAYNAVCKTAPEESWNGHVHVDFISTNNNTTAMDQAFVYSVARNVDDVSSLDSNSRKNSAVYVNIKPTEPGKVTRPDTCTGGLVYEEVFARMPSWAEPADSVKQALSFSSPAAPHQNTQHSLQACADVDDIGAASGQEEDLYKNIEEMETRHVLRNNEMYEMTIPQLEL